jgi:hypothetical protein
MPLLGPVHSGCPALVGEIPTSSSKNKNEATQFLWLLSREAGISGHATGGALELLVEIVGGLPPLLPA